jgi:hypothetical protein
VVANDQRVLVRAKAKAHAHRSLADMHDRLLAMQIGNVDDIATCPLLSVTIYLPASE